MPVIRTTVIKGFADRALQEEISRTLSDALLNVMGEVSRPWIYSMVEEVNPGAWYFSSFGDVMPDENTVASGRAQIEEHHAKRLTKATPRRSRRSWRNERVIWRPVVAHRAQLPGSGANRGVLHPIVRVPQSQSCR
jgi:phenylpyruvate tautomerase PptA (4-oxalocrotonate tautomerase family)